jgi:hypothetical protein
MMRKPTYLKGGVARYDLAVEEHLKSARDVSMTLGHEQECIAKDEKPIEEWNHGTAFSVAGFFGRKS